MRKARLTPLLLIGLLAALASAGRCDADPALTLTPPQLSQGDCFLAYLEGVGEEARPEVEWEEKKIPMFREGARWKAILPVWVETAAGPQEAAAVWQDADGKRWRVSGRIEVKARDFGSQHLRLSPEKESLYTYPGVEREYTLIRGALGRFTPAACWEGSFIPPVTTRRKTTGFGLRRYRNGEQQGVHKGIDYGAPRGAPVFAANSGEVALTAEDFRLHGKTIVIDHGRGVCTLYLHLSEILVSPQQKVKKGEIIGRVGNSGVATGPHLHYALYVAGVAVNPAWWEEQSR